VSLPELSGRIAEWFEQFGNRGVFLLQAFLRTWQPNLSEPGADRRLASDKGGATGGAALLAIPVGEKRALARDPSMSCSPSFPGCTR